MQAISNNTGDPYRENLKACIDELTFYILLIQWIWQKILDSWIEGRWKSKFSNKILDILKYRKPLTWEKILKSVEFFKVPFSHDKMWKGVMFLKNHWNASFWITYLVKTNSHIYRSQMLHMVGVKINWRRCLIFYQPHESILRSSIRLSIYIKYYY